jgi:EipB-like
MQATTILKLAAAMAGTVLLADAALAAGPKVAAHRAFYDLQLKPGRESTLLSASGRMAYEIAGSACEGWTVNYRLVNDFKPSEGNGRVVDTSSTSYETDDGLTFRYAQKEYVDNRLDGEKKISVDREPGKEGVGKATLPKAEDFVVAVDAIFPMQHQHKLMEAAIKGETRDSSVVYDGGDLAKTYKVITFIGSKKTAAPETDKGDGAALAKLALWPVSISYYPNGEPEAGQSEDTPAYQVSFDMYENGVAQNLLLDYGDFALEGKLINYEAVKQTTCN